MATAAVAYGLAQDPGKVGVVVVRIGAVAAQIDEIAIGDEADHVVFLLDHYQMMNVVPPEELLRQRRRLGRFDGADFLAHHVFDSHGYSIYAAC